MKDSRDEENAHFLAPSAPPQEASFDAAVSYNQTNREYPLVSISRVEYVDYHSKLRQNLRKFYPTKLALCVSILIFLVNLSVLTIELGFKSNWIFLESHFSKDKDKSEDMKWAEGLILFLLKALFLFIVDAHVYFFDYYKAFVSCVNMIYAVLGFVSGENMF